MHAVLGAIKTELVNLASGLQSTIPNDEPFGNAHNNWSFPGVNRRDLIGSTHALIALIDKNPVDDLGDQGETLSDFVRRLQFLRNNTLPQLWGNAGVAVPTFFATLSVLRESLTSLLKPESEDAAKTAKDLKRVATQVRAMEARISQLEPRSTNLESMLSRIEDAHEVADRLPTDIESIEEDRKRTASLLAQSTAGHSELQRLLAEARVIQQKLLDQEADASGVLAKCESAYAAATSQGLAGAFAERSKALAWSMWVWVIGLMTALICGAFFGSHQLNSLNDVMKTPGMQWPMVLLNMLVALLSVGAPIWFSWLATKQIGQRFKLSEDYAFKASISRAYEGYRREASNAGAGLDVKLLTSALNRLDELPLRLVEEHDHGSPWHELLNSPIVKEAIKTVPGFADRMTELAKKGLEATKSMGSDLSSALKATKTEATAQASSPGASPDAKE